MPPSPLWVRARRPHQQARPILLPAPGPARRPAASRDKDPPTRDDSENLRTGEDRACGRPTTAAPHDPQRDRDLRGVGPGSTARPAPRPDRSEARRAWLGQSDVAARRQPHCPVALGHAVCGDSAAQGARLAASPRPTPSSTGSYPAPAIGVFVSPDLIWGPCQSVMATPKFRARVASP